MYSVSIVDLHVTVNYMKILVVKQCFCGKFVTSNRANY